MMGRGVIAGAVGLMLGATLVLGWVALDRGAPLDGKAVALPVARSIAPINVRDHLRVRPSTVANIRADLLGFIYPSGRSPAPLALQPFPLSGIAGLSDSEQWTLSFSNGMASKVFFLTAAPAGDCLFLWHGGHEPALIYEDSAVRNLAGALLSSGCDVALLSMPLYGVNAHSGLVHDDLKAHEAAGFSPMAYFIEPVMRTLDEALTRKSYAKVGMGGLSGGGWTTTVAGALDARIDILYPVAGSMPLEMDVDPATVGGLNISSKRGDYEQSLPEFYALASYFDLYAMGAADRRAVYVYITNDNCCFPAWAMRAFSDQMSSIVRDEFAGTLIFREDITATKHEVSPWASAMMVEDFLSAR